MAKKLTHVFIHSDQDPPNYDDGDTHKTVWVNKKKNEAYVAITGWRRISQQQKEQLEKEACTMTTNTKATIETK